MSILHWAAAPVLSFLITYFVHSLVIIAVVAAVVRSVRFFRQSALRTLAWKLALLLPVITSSLVTLFPQAHCGIQISLGRQQITPANPAAQLRSAESGRLETGNARAVSRVAAGNQADHGAAASAITAADPTEADPAEAASTRAVQAAATGPRLVGPLTDQPGPLLFTLPGLVLLATGSWLVAVCIGFTGLTISWVRLRRLWQRATPCRQSQALITLQTLMRQMGVRRRVELVESSEIGGPFTAGIRRPFIVLPAGSRHCSLSAGREELDALLAHELAHVAHQDALWNLIAQTLKRVFPFQPLNGLAVKQLQIEMDFAADESAARTLGQRRGLVRCLIRAGDRLAAGRPRFSPCGLAAEMVAFRSTLGRRVARLVDAAAERPPVRTRHKFQALLCLTMIAVIVGAFVPLALANAGSRGSRDSLPPQQAKTMTTSLRTIALMLGLALPLQADEAAVSNSAEPAKLNSVPGELPAGIRRFNGMLVGRVAAKDVERGSFVVVVDAVPRVWRNSQAENPKSIVGRSVQIEGVFGKFLDVLITTRIGETIEFECKYADGDLVFPGELLRKVAPYKPEDYPVLPEEFRGFRGSVVADIRQKDAETFELIVQVQKIKDVWKGSQAKRPESMVGRKMMLAGFWNRKDAYHALKTGQRIEVGMQHIGRQSDHLTVAEFVRPSEQVSEERMMRADRAADSMDRERAAGGFRGILVGRLTQKDVERGTFRATVDAVARIWENNELRQPRSLIGTTVTLYDVPPKMLDALVVTRVGETLQFAALHDGEDRLRVGEVLRKVPPVKPGDYPELPDGFRGFRGMLRAKVVERDERLWSLKVQVTEVVESFKNDRSKNAAGIVGRQVLLGGFWNRKDAFHSLSVGDTIQTGAAHPGGAVDHLNVIEGVRRLDD